MRTMALKCVSACITTYLQRTAPETRGRELPPLVRQPLALTLGLLRKNVLHTSEQRVRRESIQCPAHTLRLMIPDAQHHATLSKLRSECFGKVKRFEA